LSAAETLARDCGDLFEVTVLEAKRCTGGRAGSFTDPASGQSVDYCQHVAMGCCTNLLALLDRCGLGEAMQRYRSLEFRHPDHPPSRFVASRWLPPPLHLAGAIGKLRYLSAAQRRQIRRAMWRLMRTPADTLAHETARHWLDQQGQDEDTIGLFWDVVLVSALGEQTAAVSMAAARKVFLDGFAAARHACDVLVPTKPLADLFGRSLPDEIARLGVEVLTAQNVTTLQAAAHSTVARSIGDPVAAVRIQTSSGRQWQADHLISAVPWHAVGKLTRDLPWDSPREWEAIPASAITGMHLWFDRQITQRPHAVLVGTLAQWLFRQPLAEPSSPAGYYYQVVISASRAHRGESQQELVSQVMDELRHEFPLARQATLLRSKVVTDPQSVFSVSPEVERLRPQARTALPWFHLAGDWIRTGWPATMEGAVISGRMAAESVRRSEGRPGTAIDPGLTPGQLAKWMIVH
jgi:squalene-associated FAD-dependent desaturase